MSEPKVYILIINYKTWQDTIECLESVFQLDYPNFHVVVIDNHSENNSLEMIEKWAQGAQEVFYQHAKQLKDLSTPSVPKPIFYQKLQSQSLTSPALSTQLTLIQASENRGFSAGNNIGIRYAGLLDDYQYLWLLNNDTVVEKNALSELVRKAEENLKLKIGLIGAKVMYYDQPCIFQCVGGGRYNPLLATPAPIGSNEKDVGQYDIEELPSQMYLVMGACTLVSKPFIQDVGYMGEEYFLYFEEQDWAERGRRKGNWQLGYAYKSKIYHKSGKSTGGKNRVQMTSFSDFYYQRSKILFTKKFYPQFLPFIYVSFIGIFLRRLQIGKAKHIPLLLKMLLQPNKMYPGK
jgi:GT2 family glycosyltransferase